MIPYLVLGLIQGLTEFLPISSSGHLVLAEKLFGLASPGLVFEACLHLATVVAILVFFRRDIAELARALTPRGHVDRRKEIGLLLLGTVPIVVVGLVLRGSAESWFHSLWVVGVGWMATAGMLLLADRRAHPSGPARPSVAGALGMGVAQSAALVPGVSRSGFTIGAGMLAGLRPERAARFSFLLSVPAVVGAAGLSLWGGMQEHSGAGSNLVGVLAGSVVAFLVGLVALRVFLSLLGRVRLWPFALYCAAFSLAAFTVAALG